MNITVRTPYADEFAEREDAWEAPDALAATQAERMAEHLGRKAVSGTAMVSPKRERRVTSLAVMIGAGIAALGCVALAWAIFG